MSFLNSGCGMGLVAGSRPNIDVLEKSLHIGESTPADVAAALGEPSGKGGIMLPIESKSRTMWSYYYEEGTLEDARRIFMFVWFRSRSIRRIHMVFQFAKVDGSMVSGLAARIRLLQPCAKASNGRVVIIDKESAKLIVGRFILVLCTAAGLG